MATVAVLAVVAALAGTGIFLFRDEEPSPSVSPSPPPGLASPGPGTDADFTFTEVEVSCGFENIISSEEQLPAEGEFCVADFIVTNEGEEDRALDISCQFLIDADGSRYLPSGKANSLDPSSDQLFNAGLGAGETMDEGAVHFDVPKGASIVELELRGACDSPGLSFPV